MEEITKYTPETPAQAQNPMQIISAAVMAGNVPVETMRALLDLETQYKQREAQKAFSGAVVKFQHECPIVEKGDSANGKPYARMDRIARAISPHMKACGLAVTWESVRFNETMTVCTIDGTLLHADGYSRPIHAEIAVPKGNPSQNSAQVCASAETYAKRYAICGCLGIYTGDDNDGSAAVPSLTAAQIAELTSAGKAANFDDARIIKMLAVAARDGFEKTMRAVKTAAGVKS